MSINTLKTTLGFVLTRFEQILPLSMQRKSLHSIYNHCVVASTFQTSGQPTARQFAAIQNSGVTTVINLAPHDVENALQDEASVLADLGLQYVHIPVEFNNPTDAKFNEFCAALQATPASKLWVHCAANMRVSAFMYRYRCSVLGEEPAIAKKAMMQIWQPFGVWKKFLANS